MMSISFEQVAGLVRDQFTVMSKTGKLFVSSIKGHELWDLYINSFNPKVIFRDPNSSIDNCNRDRHFIQTYGNIVAIDENNNIITMFDVNVRGTRYEESLYNMREALMNSSIHSAFKIAYGDLLSMPYQKTNKTQDLYQLGYGPTNKIYTPEEVAKFGVVEEGKVYTFHHFHVLIPKSFVLFGDAESTNAYSNTQRTTHDLFIKGLNIPLETLEVVRDLMIQESLLRAELYQHKVEEFIQIKQEYENLPSNERTNWTWKKFLDIPFARFANELIGTTCIDLAEGKDINVVCREFNKRVDPANHMKAKAPLTQTQINNTAKRIEEMGYTDSFDRRFAVLDDINEGNTLNEILHTSGDKPTSTTGGLFAGVKPTAPSAKELSRHLKAELEQVEEVSIETFLEDILPNSKSIEVFLEPGFSKNLVTMTTANNKQCKPLFKWSNPFSWTYAGNLAGKSFLKEAVKVAGGNVEGVLRASLAWNESGNDGSDLDVWCLQPNGERIGFSTAFKKDRSDATFSSCGGQLDVDVINPDGKLAVENIYFRSLNELKEGTYGFYVNPYNTRNSQGFKFQVDMDGEVYDYEFNPPVDRDVHIAEVTFSKGTFSIKHLLEPVAFSTKTLWGLDTNQFHKVNLMCLSPNYWGDNAVGSKHYFFFLHNCHSDVPMRSFHIENLNSELLQDRKVLEVLGMTTMLTPADKQLAGLGFTNDSKESLVVKVQGSFKRTVRIKF